MSEDKLTRAAFEKIRSCAEGNGIDAKKIELLGSDETTLTVKAEMTLKLEMVREKAAYPGAFRNAKGLGKGRSEKVANDAAIDEKIRELKTKTETGGYWSKDAERQLKAEPGHAWGLEKADVIIESVQHVYYFETQCTSCAGTTTINCAACHAQGRVECTYCHQTGLENCSACGGTGLNSAYPDQHCSYCNGTRQVYCRECRGQRSVQCYQCRGQGRNKCNTCNGNGVFTNEECVTPTAKAEFHIVDTHGLPGGFRKAIARAGTKTLAKGHATISVQELTAKENGDPVIPYTAVMPYAEMRVKINGKPMRCALLGHKGVILDLPHFLDNALEDKIAQLSANTKSPDSLSKALQLRICREAFGLLQLKQADARMLRQLYPAGLSMEMAEQIMGMMRKLVHGQTITTRMVAAAVSVLLFVALDYGIIASNIRAMLGAAATPISVFVFDVVLCIGGYFLQNYLLKLVAAKKLQHQLGGQEKVISQSAGGVGIIAGILVMVIYLGMLFALKAQPMWRDIWQGIFTHSIG